MKKIAITLLLLFVGIPIGFASIKSGRQKDNFFGNRKYKITIVNLTKGQPMTPPVVALHSSETSLYVLGQEASQGLKELSQDGATDTIVGELESNGYVYHHAVGTGLILPGESQEITIKSHRGRISLVAMLARTNDAIVAFNIPTAHLRDKVSFLAPVYDSGAENNTESCQHIPAPPCGNPGVGTDGGEGIVHPHPGIQNIGDLDPLRDAFASKVAKITIEAVRH